MDLQDLQQANLHSTVVLLKAKCPRLRTYTGFLFTFYCSSIKGLRRNGGIKDE